MIREPKSYTDAWGEAFTAGPITAEKYGIGADRCSNSSIVLDKEGARTLAADLIAFADSQQQETENEG